MATLLFPEMRPMQTELTVPPTDDVRNATPGVMVQRYGFFPDLQTFFKNILSFIIFMLPLQRSILLQESLQAVATPALNIQI